MDFLLPRLHLEPTYTESSVTDVKWHDAICDNVVFVPWEDFDGIVTKTQKQLAEVDVKFINSANLILCPNTGKNPDNSDTDKNSASEGQEVFDMAYMVEFYTDSTSTDGLHDNLFRATGLLLRGLHEEKKLRIVNRGYSSQLGMELDAKDEHLPHHITIRPDRLLAYQPPAQLKRLPICTFEWKGPGLDFTCVGGDSGVASASLMECLLEEAVCKAMKDNPKGPYPFLGVNGLTAFHLNEKQTKESSIATDSNVANPGFEKQTVSREISGASSLPNLLQQGKSSEDMASQEVPKTKQNHKKILEILVRSGTTFESLISPTIMSATFTYLFRDRGKSVLSNQAVKFARITRIAVAQAISQGLLSESGCFYLSTYLMGLAFEIRGLDNEGKVVVAVSRPYHCHQKPGLVHSCLALAHYSVERLSEGGNDVATRIRKCAKVISTSQFHVRSGMRNVALPSRTNQGGNMSEGRTQSNSSKRHKKNDNVQHDSSEFLFDDSNSESIRCCSPNNLNDVSNSEENHSAKVSVWSPVTYYEDSSACDYIPDLQEQLKATFQSCSRVLAIGGSGVVLEGTWKGEKVAVKTWNGCKSEGSLAMISEVEMYEYIQNMAPSILGDAVPRFFVGLSARRPCEGSVYDKESILITELVGLKIWRDPNGLTRVGESSTSHLSTEEELDLRNAALEALSCLHHYGITHGDVSLRNLRATRIVESGGGVKWKAWWIDLGNAQNSELPALSQNSFCFKYEIERCRSLFATCDDA